MAIKIAGVEVIDDNLTFPNRMTFGQHASGAGMWIDTGGTHNWFAGTDTSSQYRLYYNGNRLTLTTGGALSVASLSTGTITATGDSSFYNNLLVGALNSTASRRLEISADTGQWAYTRYKTDNYLWDIGAKSNDHSGDLQFRPNGNSTGRMVLTKDGNLEVGGGIEMGAEDGTTGGWTYPKIKVKNKDFWFDSVENKTYTFAHNIPNGKTRILGVFVNPCITQLNDINDAAAGGDIPAQSAISAAGTVQDETNMGREYQTYYDDTNVYVHRDGAAVHLEYMKCFITIIYQVDETWG
tara:strand:+ start:633 stop:1520 length:888 start_codon:yes stop_codon:yes gene_type:complete